jgi:hypothetical protein
MPETSSTTLVRADHKEELPINRQREVHHHDAVLTRESPELGRYMRLGHEPPDRLLACADVPGSGKGAP